MELSLREKQNLERLYPYLAECTLFLARDHHFPLAKPCNIVAYGRGVRHTIKGGSGSGDVNASFFTIIDDGLTAAGFNILNKEWLDQLDALYPEKRKHWVKDIKHQAKKMKMLAPVYAIGRTMPEIEYNLPLNYEADAAIYVVSRMSGEGADREIKKGDILLNDSEVRDILELNKKYEKFMLVINAGGVVDLSRVQEVRNILILSELGTETGRVLADILLGKVNPSGKLSTTWAYIEDYPYDKEIPLHDTIYKEGKYVGYRYFDSFNIAPLYPFGYGLSYTNFKIDNYSIKKNGNHVEIKAQVKNIGHYNGKEVIQAYISYLGKKESCYQELIGFTKTKELKPNESDEVTIDIDLENSAKYDKEKEVYHLDDGAYLLRVGNSSRDTVPVGIIDLEDDIIFEEAPHIYDHAIVEEINSNFTKEKPSKLPQINLKQLDFEIKPYQKEELFVPDIIKDIPTSDLIRMNAGYINEQHSASYIGESSTAAPGAAGEISNAFKKHFHQNVVMADGPAGLRLTRSYYKKKNKVIKLEFNAFLVEAIEFFPQPLKFMLKHTLLKKRNTDKIDKIYYQYCTALPIATAIAQSFNKDLAYLAGDIVGNEMEEYQVDLWLAPAMNIQRTIMCGRNFEYYSEDPFLTGMMATCVTKGVQSHPHKGVVIKHFAANNQETFRYVNNSIVSEETLREIYLKGFEMCIRDANPKGIMSSYNLINDVHSSEYVPLIHDYLYNERSFKGIVMTDWIMRGSKPRLAKYDISRIQNVFKTSTSLFMPGSRYDIKQLTKEIKKNPSERKQLEINATRLYKNFSK